MSLDVSIQAQIISLLKRLCHEHGTAVMLVTHDPEIASVTPRRIEIRDGKIANEIDPKLGGEAPKFKEIKAKQSQLIRDMTA